MTETAATAAADPAREARPAFRPIADYGLLADCNSSALVDRHGSIDWLCFPRYDGEALFARILDPDGGHWSIQPTRAFSSERRYLPGSLVIETTFVTDSGTVRLTDAMAFAEGQRRHDLGFDAPHELMRLVEGVSGEVELEMELAPRPEYGLVRPLFRAEGDGGRTFGGPCRLTARAGVPIGIEDADMRSSFTLAEGDRIGFSVRWAPVESREPPPPTAPADVASRIGDTVEAWRSWEAMHDIYEGPHHDLVQMSARVLKGLTYRPTGAIVAAPTTSLPETVGGERNWDYRYSWIRDASLTIEALYIGACSDEADEFVSFMTSSAGGRAEQGSLQIMYGIGGEHDLSERELPQLRGWRDSGPVRVGNGAWDQTQLDVYGELLNSIYDDSRKVGSLEGAGIDVIRGAGRIAGPGKVAVGDQTYGVREIIISTGSEPVIPPVPGLAGLDVWTNREATAMKELPRRLLVMGGGPVGVEIAQAVRRMGASVALVEGMDHLLAREPRSLGEALGEALSAEGIEICLGQYASAVRKEGGDFVVEFDEREELRGDRLLVATGRRPRVEEIGLETVGIDPGKRGIEVDARMAAGDGVWAIGDVTGIWPLTYMGKYQGRIAAANILGHPREANYDAVPRVVFTDPQVAAVGEAEGPLTATVPLSDVPRTATYTRAYAERPGFLTLVSDGERLTGAYALGPEAGEWLQQATLAIRARVPLEVMNDTIQPFPTFSEVFLHGLEGLAAKAPAAA